MLDDYVCHGQNSGYLIDKIALQNLLHFANSYLIQYLPAVYVEILGTGRPKLIAGETIAHSRPKLIAGETIAHSRPKLIAGETIAHPSRNGRPQLRKGRTYSNSSSILTTKVRITVHVM